MVVFRVSKYDPSLRLPNGAYQRDEWTSVSDVGRVFEGRVVTCSEYLLAEASYVQAVHCFMNQLGLRTLRVTGLEVSDHSFDCLPCGLADETGARVRAVVDGAQVSGSELDWIVRLALREVLWCLLKGDNGFFVDFGYDYCVRIGSHLLEFEAPGLPPGIFAEIFDSVGPEEPGLDEDD